MVFIVFKIDVDILCGICEGVFNFVCMLCEYEVGVIFFFSFGFDYIGWVLCCVFCFGFFKKVFCMLVVEYYGFCMLMYGVLLLGFDIGCKVVVEMCVIVEVGFEIGIYMWDYVFW